MGMQTAQILTTLAGHKAAVNCTYWLPNSKFAFKGTSSLVSSYKKAANKFMIMGLEFRKYSIQFLIIGQEIALKVVKQKKRLKILVGYLYDCQFTQNMNLVFGWSWY